MRETFASETPSFAFLAPDRNESGCHYTLYVEDPAKPQWPEALDRALRRNPHYAYCRDPGQLRPVRLFVIAGSAYEAFLQHQCSNGARLGDIKPVALSSASNWSEVFRGKY